MRAETARPSVAHTHDEAARASYRMFMRVYKKAVKTEKREFYAASIASANYWLAQLFRTIQLLTSFPQGIQNSKELAIGCEAFTTCFRDKVLSVCQDLPAMVDTVRELDVPCLSSDPNLDFFC